MANYIGNQIQRGEFKKLDSIESSFDGSTTTFNLVFNGTDVQVGDTTALVVSLNGVIQEPNEAYTLGNGGSQIVFSSAPAAGNTCFITQLGGIGDTVTPTDGSVTSSKIADDAVTLAKIADDSITSAKLFDNLEFSGSYVKIPIGTTAERPATGATGMLRFNTDFGRLEQFVDGGWASIDTPPTLTSLSYSGSLLAADPAGGETITLTGDNLQAGLTITVGGTAAASVTYISGTSVQFTTPAKSAGDYDVKLTNANGLSATLQDGISYNGTPAFSTAAGQVGSDIVPGSTIPTITIVAAEPDGGTLSYSITSGALPSGISMNSSGQITGTAPSPAGTTTYNFTVTATDDENQTNSRAFNLVVLRPVYAYQVPQSIQFVDDYTQYLSWTPTTAGNRRTFTWSGWVKRGSFTGDYQGLFLGSGLDTGIFFDPNDKINVNMASPNYHTITSAAQFRDTNSWYHIVYATDTTQAVEADRLSVWVNGVKQTMTGASGYAPQNAESDINNTTLHTLGTHTSTNYRFDGYMAEVNFVDGQALSPTNFGEFYNGVWVPKEYTGTYGTNGFYLPMRNDETTDAFNIVTWKGTNEWKSLTGVGFSPDFVLHKSLGVGQWYWWDKARGADVGLYIPDDVAENTYQSYGGLKSFDPDGFTVWQNPAVGNEINNSNNNHVAYCWKAGDPVTDTNGTITTTVRANQTAGFSIITWTATDTDETVGHGLGVAPDVFIVKNREVGAEAWNVYHSAMGNNQRVMLDSNVAASTVSIWNNTDPTSTVMPVSGDNGTNGAAGVAYVAYAFAEKAGYSKFGSYSGNDTTSGPYVTCGFRPALVIVKCTNLNEHWIAVDSSKDNVSPYGKHLYPNLLNAQGDSSAVQFLFDDNGFQPVGADDAINGYAGGTGNYIYMAFADTSTYKFWKDQSGNDNDWQQVSGGIYQISNDSPTE